MQIYAVVMPALIAVWHLTQGQAGMLATSALLVSSLGGWIAGMLADRIGRARVLRITIVWFATFTFLSGLTNSYEQLLITRSLQGLGFGGEWAAGAVLIGEVINKNVRGRAVGSVQSGWAVGYGAAVLLFTVVFSILPTEQAWRTLFYIGAVPAVAVLWFCRNLEEPELFRKSQVAARKKESSLLAIFRPPLLRTTFVASLLATGVLGGYGTYASGTQIPRAYLRHKSFES